MSKKFISILIFLSLFSFSFLYSTTIIVDINGGGAYTSIQEGIDASTNGDTVLVFPGTYYENVNFNGKSITLASLELTTGNESYVDSTIIDGNQISSCIRLENEETAIIRGLSITNGFGYVDNSYVGRLGGGIRAYSFYNSEPIDISVINCKIYNNYAESGGAIIIRKSIAYLSGVNIFNNYATIGGGILVRDNSELTFDETNRCNIYNNYAGAGSDILGVDTGDIEVIVDTFTVLEPMGYFAEYSQNVHDTGEFTFDIQNYWLETVNHNLYVATDGDDSNSGLTPEEPLRTIAWALHKIESDSLDPKTVYVASGTYSQSLNNQIFPLGCKSYVSLIGENMNTILLNDAFASVVIKAQLSKKNFSIENFTIHSDYDEIGAIISIVNDCNNIILKNLIIEDCVSIDSGISTIYEADILYENVIFRNNTADQCAGLWHERNNAILRNCIFDNNHSTGTYPSSYANYSNFYFLATDYLIIENCVFSNSSTVNPEWDAYTTFAIGRKQFCEPLVNIKNCLFYNNSSVSKAAISISSDYNPIPNNIINCTFADNSSNSSTLLLCGVNSIYNTIMHDSTDYEIELPDFSPHGYIHTLNVSYSNIKNGEEGIYNQNGVNIVNWLEGNIDADPQFWGGEPFSYELTEDSPCIDAGTPDTTGLNLPPTDLAGNPRIYNGRIDIGAYEWQGEGIGEPDTTFVNELYLFQNTPNPFKDETEILFITTDYERVKDYTLSIYNVKGQLVRRYSGRTNDFWVKTKITWDGTDENGNKVSPGVYFYKLEYGDNAVVRKMTLVE